MTRGRRAAAAYALLEEITTLAQHHARTGEASYPEEWSKTTLPTGGTANANWRIYHSAYRRALAERYLAHVNHPHPDAFAFAVSRRPSRLASLATDKERAQYDAGLFALDDGTEFPTPETWLYALAALGEAHDLPTLEAGLERIGQEASERLHAAELEAERAEREKAERERDALAEQLQHVTPGLSKSVVFPRPVLQSGYDPKYFARLHDKLEQRELFVTADASGELDRAFLLEHSGVTIPPAQLAHLDPLEVRALFGVLRLFSRYNDKTEYTTDQVVVPASLLFDATHTSRSGSQRRAQFNALLKLSERVLYFATVVEYEGRSILTGERSPLFTLRPRWADSDDRRRALSASDATEVVRQWTARGHVNAGESMPEWTGPLPDSFVLALPPVVRTLTGALVLNADILERLERGAREVHRGKKTHPGFSSLALPLLMRIAQTVQKAQRSDDGTRARSFVDRHAFLCEYYGAEQVAKARSRGKFREKMLAPYQTAVQTLLAGGLVAHYNPDHTTAKGEHRDVFELAPDVVRGSQRTGAALPDPAQQALPLPGKRPKKPGRAAAAKMRK